MKQKAPKVQLMWAIVRNGRVGMERLYATRSLARSWQTLLGGSVVRVELRVIK